jgi:hypothetical protein
MTNELEQRIRQASIQHQARLQRQNQQAQPDAPGCDKLPEKDRENARLLYGEAILSKTPSSWSQEEKDFVRGSVNSTLKDLGY